MKITLCGSTKFKKEFEEWNRKLTMAGHIVYSVSCFGHADNIPHTEEEKKHLDRIHFMKILNSGAIFVINKDYYVDESTKNEINWALLNNKEVFNMSSIKDREVLRTYPWRKNNNDN